MSLHTNGLPAVPRALGLPTAELRRALANVTDPNMVGAGMVLSTRGNVYGDVRSVDPATVATRRRRNKAARIARRAARR